MGACMMFFDKMGTSTGMDVLLDGMQVLPLADILFKNLIFPGIALLLINGIPNLIATFLLFKKVKGGPILGIVLGITLMLWITLQFFIYETNHLSIIYFIIGFLELITGIFCYVGFSQSNFYFNIDDYQNVGTNNDLLVVYFSRMGYTKKIAYEMANNTGADILEIKAKERITGSIGFWWCGRFGMHKWGMPIEEMQIDFSKYPSVTICSPIWVFNICAPIREFCKINAGKIKNVNYVVNHFMNCKFEKTKVEMDTLLKTKHNSFRSFSCHYGKTKELK